MASKEYLTNKVQKYLDSKKLRYNFNEGEKENTFQLQLPIKGKLSAIIEHVSIRDSRVQCRAVSIIKARADTYNDVVEYLTRANYGMTVGGFEFDYNDGEIAFSYCLCASGGKVSKKDIETAFIIPILMMRRYGDGLVKALMGCGNPAEDIAFAESGAVDA